MFTTRISTVASTTVLAAMVGLTALGAATATAAPSTTAQDAEFLGGMAEEDITFSTPQAGVALAHHICGEFATGASFDAIAYEGRQNNSTLSDYQLGYVIGGSVAVYCPQYTDQLPA